MNKKVYALYLLVLCAISMPLEAVDWRTWLTNMYQRHYSSRSTAFKILAPASLVGLCALAYYKHTVNQQTQQLQAPQKSIEKPKTEETSSSNQVTLNQKLTPKQQLLLNAQRELEESKRRVEEADRRLQEGEREAERVKRANEKQQEQDRIERAKQQLAKERRKEDELLPAKQLFLANFNKHQAEQSQILPILPKDEQLPYTVNLMWINRDLQPQQQYIFPSKNNEYVTTVLKWAELNPKSSVNLWLDSKLTPLQAIKNTSATITDQIKNHAHVAPILLKDVRELSHVKAHPEVFCDKTPVYFRADLLRIIAGFETLSRAKKDYFVYADWDVEPMSQKELFDEQTQDDLKKYGLLMAKTDFRQYENSFYMLSNEVPNLFIAVDRALIELNIKRAYNALRGKFYDSAGYQPVKGPLNQLAQIVYDSYPSMFKYFYHLQGLGLLEIQFPVGSEKNYDYDSDGLKPFGLKQLDQNTLLFTPEIDQSSLINRFRKICIPTKKVSAPTASLKYD